MRKFIALLAILLLIGGGVAGAQCRDGDVFGQGARCTKFVRLASNETTLVSRGAVLVYDVSNTNNSAASASFSVDLANASADAGFVAGVVQKDVGLAVDNLDEVSAGQVWVEVLTRGKGVVRAKTTEVYASGNALFVAASYDASIVQVTSAGGIADSDPIGFALDDYAVSATNTVQLIDAYITIE